MNTLSHGATSNTKQPQKSRVIDLSIFNYSLKTAAFRYGVISLMALINAHIRIGLLPFQENYAFPAQSILFGLIFGLTVCTSSWIFSNYFKEKLFRDSIIDFRSIVVFLFHNSLVGIAVFTVLTIIIAGFPIPVLFYIIYSFITLSIIIIENLLFLVYGMVISNSELSKEVSRIDRKAILIPTGSKTHKVEIDEIAFIELRNGIVVFNLNNQRVINSQFDSLEELEKELPRKLFYRANRQFIVHRDAIQNIKKDINRKLKVLVSSENQDKEITVSRYKSRELQNWLNGIF